MSIFDVPLARCEAMRTMVVTDQTQGQCAREHGCPPGMACPLCGCFVGRDWSAEAIPPTAVKAAPKRRRKTPG